MNAIYVRMLIYILHIRFIAFASNNNFVCSFRKWNRKVLQMCTIIVLYVMIVKSFRYKDFGSVLYINEMMMMMMVVSCVFHKT